MNCRHGAKGAFDRAAGHDLSGAMHLRVLRGYADKNGPSIARQFLPTSKGSPRL